MKSKLFTWPNIITLLNLLSGTVAVIAMVSLHSQQALKLSFVLILAAVVFDFLDGFVARLTHSASPIGLQLDSLADMVSFGLLPAIIAMKLFYILGGNGIWSALLLTLPLSAALRLARFNVEADSAPADYFKGLPVPAVALFIASVGWYADPLVSLASDSAPWICLACGLLLALLMISSVKMFSLKFHDFSFRNNAVRYIFLLFSIVFVAIAGILGIALSILLYVLFSVICRLLRLN